MKVSMDDSRLNNLSELKSFLTSAKLLVLQTKTINAKYRFINRVRRRFNYRGYKKAQALRLIKRSLNGDLTRTVYRSRSSTSTRTEGVNLSTKWWLSC